MLRNLTNPRILIIKKDIDLTAFFIPAGIVEAPDSFTCILTTNNPSAGMVQVEPDIDRYQVGDTITITALPEIGFVFSSWSDDTTNHSNPRIIVIGKDIRITATFAASEAIETITLSPGESINERIRQLSGTAIPGALLVPTPGLYEEGTIEFEGRIDIPILRR